jgi:hypothetical protein
MKCSFSRHAIWFTPVANRSFHICPTLHSKFIALSNSRNFGNFFTGEPFACQQNPLVFYNVIPRHQWKKYHSIPWHGRNHFRSHRRGLRHNGSSSEEETISFLRCNRMRRMAKNPPQPDSLSPMSADVAKSKESDTVRVNFSAFGGCGERRGISHSQNYTTYHSLISSGVAVSRTLSKTATFRDSRQRPFLQLYKSLSCQPSSANLEPKGSDTQSDSLAVSPTIERCINALTLMHLINLTEFSRMKVENLPPYNHVPIRIQTTFFIENTRKLEPV